MKIISIALSSLLLYNIIKCPCEQLVACTQTLNLVITGTLFGMILFKFPN